MPKIIYYCSYCGKDFKDEANALDCEKSHIIPVSFGQTEYNNYYTNGIGYPSEIEIVFSDGKTRTYCYEE